MGQAMLPAYQCSCANGDDFDAQLDYAVQTDKGAPSATPFFTMDKLSQSDPFVGRTGAASPRGKAAASPRGTPRGDILDSSGRESTYNDAPSAGNIAAALAYHG
eukprot:gnl/TRDRNA2_/TRDRNA2_196914_c0_seq1.p3 gnl/TRDRNA2_/TRDRNA2_196914_c0~~gnl/TRDRNA2_/TRDRNA2_196914_c0_seq1.p3  ORF type:complete len:104 (-),score=13.50 gnl/TRDRNA2_/TRDRNA2_196914_c0_seq1:138-449(-)